MHIDIYNRTKQANPYSFVPGVPLWIQYAFIDQVFRFNAASFRLVEPCNIAILVLSRNYLFSAQTVLIILISNKVI